MMLTMGAAYRFLMRFINMLMIKEERRIQIGIMTA